MSSERYQLNDGTVVDTTMATAVYEEDTYWDGRNRISAATGSQWEHQTLYRSKKGRYYLVCSSDWQGTADHAKWLSNRDAARWIARNGRDMPAELKALADEDVE